MKESVIAALVGTLMTSAMPAVAEPVSDTKAKECVVLLHGLARSEKSMRKMERALIKEGYQVKNIGYPSRKHAIDELVNLSVKKGLEACQGDQIEKVHFVTHSLGGILVRKYFKEGSKEKLGRVVMLGPPNQGSQVVDKLHNLPGFAWINGPTGQQLGTGDRSVPVELPKVNYEVGVVAGSVSFNFFLSMLIPGSDDGKVSVENTKVSGMKDFIVMKTSHPFMAKNKKVIRQAINFLESGSFEK